MQKDDLSVRIEKVKETIRRLKAQGKRVTDKLWGFEYEIVNNDKYCGKLLYILPGFESSLHYHKVKDETFMCLEGTVGLEVLEDTGEWYDYDQHYTDFEVLKSWCHDAYRLEPGVAHRFWAIDGPAVVAEFSTQHSDSDVVRLDESHMLESRQEPCEQDNIEDQVNETTEAPDWRLDDWPD